MKKPKYDMPKPGGAIYLLIRYGQFVVNDANTVKVFVSRDHYEWYRRRYPTRILSTDRLVKYVQDFDLDPKTKEDL